MLEALRGTRALAGDEELGSYGSRLISPPIRYSCITNDAANLLRAETHD